MYAIETQNASGTVFDSDNAVSSDTITNGGTLTSTDVAPYGAPTPLAGTSGNCVISFTTVNPIPADGKIVVTFPSGFAFDSGGTTAVSGTPTGLDGLFAVGKAGQVVTITRSNGTQAAAGAKTITLSYVQNPTAKGSTGTYAIQTNTASSSLTTGEIDIDAAVAADMIFFVDLTSWNLDMNAGMLTMNFNVTVDKSTLAATGITIQDAATASSGKSYTLTGGTTNSSNGTTIVVNLTATDINGIKAINGMAKSQSNSYICITSATIKDTNTPLVARVGKECCCYFYVYEHAY